MENYVKKKELKDRIEYLDDEERYHRIDGPAYVVTAGANKGYTLYAINGEYHREGAPAIVYANGDESWYVKGQLHRIGGPAVNTKTVKKWFRKDKLHRLNAPAVITSSKKEFYEFGIFLRDKK
jgi:hypothetical protein